MLPGETRAQAEGLAVTGLIGTFVEMEALAVHLRRRAVAVSLDQLRHAVWSVPPRLDTGIQNACRPPDLHGEADEPPDA